VTAIREPGGGETMAAVVVPSNAHLIPEVAA